MMTPGQREFIEVILETRMFPEEIVAAVEVLLAETNEAVTKDQAMHLIQNLMKAPERDLDEYSGDMGRHVGGVIHR